MLWELFWRRFECLDHFVSYWKVFNGTSDKLGVSLVLLEQLLENNGFIWMSFNLKKMKFFIIGLCDSKICGSR